MGRIVFRKMHGLGNDFVVLDQRRESMSIDAAGARALADRHTGVGCDQILALTPPHDPRAQVFMRILNPDGSEAEACGNGTRCIAALLAAETGRSEMAIETAVGLLQASVDGDGVATVDMGPPRLAWQDVPLARAMDTLHVDLRCGPLADPVCTSMGNPHATFFVGDPDAVDLAALGPRLEHDPLFPQRANIGVAMVRADGVLRLRVWERGAGLTRACGSAACAALVAACRRGLAGDRAVVALDGGNLEISWPERGHVLMRGPATLSFEGSFDAALLGH
jgi:diaminopimelate epimerase